MLLSRRSLLASTLGLVAAPVRGGNSPFQKDMFAESEAYERFMGRWSRKLAPPFARFAEIGAGQDVLDVGSGTGALAAAVVAAAPTARVVGVDPSPGYVKYAQSHVGTERARFLVGDARDLRFPDATFDRTLSLLVMNFIPDPAKALGEMTRVTRPGGFVAAAVWDYGGAMEMLRVFWDEAVARDPGIASRDERHMPLCRQGELGALWRAHGFRSLAETSLTIQLSFASFDDYWTPFLGGQGPAGAYVASLPDADRAALEARLRRRLVGTGGSRPFTLGAQAWAVRGIVTPREPGTPAQPVSD
jgi:SAM-dependent methyltransferase